MTKIEILETIKHEGHVFTKEEIRIVDDKLAGYFCGNGWAKDLTGKSPTGERDTAEKTLDVHNAKNGTSAPQIGVAKNG